MAKKKSEKAKSTKKKANVKNMHKFLDNVSKEKNFWAIDGQVLKNIFELSEELEHMAPEAYKFHSKKEGNDFVNWVRDVVQDQELAAQLESSQNQSDSHKIVLKRLVQLLKI